jgi:tetratricopeptide (TPR) repeat protein
MRRIVLAAAIAAALGAAVPAQAQMPGIPGGGMGNPGAPGGRPGMSAPDESSAPREEKPDAVSQRAFKLAEKSLQKGKDHEAAAAKATSPDKRASEIEKAGDEYGRAVDLFTVALLGRPELVEAWDGVGFVHLRLGAYRESIDDYDHALKYRPDLQEAIMHRAEAYLNIDRLEDAESAYLDLFAHSRDLADELMVAMQKWLADHRQDAKGMRPAQIDAFDAWLQERDKIAKQAVS